MLMELKEGSWALSIGRLLLLITFLHAMVTWSLTKDIADHEMDTLYGLLAYVLGGKITDAIKTWRR